MPEDNIRLLLQNIFDEQNELRSDIKVIHATMATKADVSAFRATLDDHTERFTEIGRSVDEHRNFIGRS